SCSILVNCILMLLSDSKRNFLLAREELIHIHILNLLLLWDFICIMFLVVRWYNDEHRQTVFESIVFISTREHIIECLLMFVVIMFSVMMFVVVVILFFCTGT